MDDFERELQEITEAAGRSKRWALVRGNTVGRTAKRPAAETLQS